MYCQQCGKPLKMAATGRPRRYCSDVCRKAASRSRKAATGVAGRELPPLSAMSAHDIKRECLGRLMEVLMSPSCPANAVAALSREACRLADELQAFSEPLGLFDNSDDPVSVDGPDIV